jgi:hypothetical protein
MQIKGSLQAETERRQYSYDEQESITAIQEGCSTIIVR